MLKRYLLPALIIIALAATGLFLGMNLGGNNYPNFEFMGGKGYEATGYLGAILGALIGLIIALTMIRSNANKNL